MARGAKYNRRLCRGFGVRPDMGRNRMRKMIGFTAPQTISMSSQRHRSVRREIILALTAGLASVLSLVSTRGDDGPKQSGGKLVIAMSDSLPGVPAAAQFRGLILVDPENGAIKNIPGRDLESGFLSPDGRWLATVNTGAEFPENVGIWIEDVTGKTPAKRIFDRTGVPTWSGDGKQLVICTQAARGKYETYRVNSDGSDLTKLPIPQTELVVDWSTRRDLACLVEPKAQNERNPPSLDASRRDRISRNRERSCRRRPLPDLSKWPRSRLHRHEGQWGQCD